MLLKAFVRLSLCFAVYALASAGIPAHLTACRRKPPPGQAGRPKICNFLCDTGLQPFVDGENQNSRCVMDFSLISGG
jgi:hypothetical protein